jgi:hypothetical protein
LHRIHLIVPPHSCPEQLDRRRVVWPRKQPVTSSKPWGWCWGNELSPWRRRRRSAAAWGAQRRAGLWPGRVSRSRPAARGQSDDRVRPVTSPDHGTPSPHVIVPASSRKTPVKPSRPGSVCASSTLLTWETIPGPSADTSILACGQVRGRGGPGESAALDWQPPYFGRTYSLGAKR